MKNKIVLYGAFDRYNYGDNLMPILLKMYLEKYQPSLLESYELVYSSISDSDLSQYGCLPSQNISSVIKKLTSDDVIIVVGGAVLCTSNLTLYFHMPKPKRLSRIFSLFSNSSRSVIRKSFKAFVDLVYKSPWDYPYLPEPLHLPEKVSVRYNTVGGGFSTVPMLEQVAIKARLEKATYISARDTKTLNNLYSLSTTIPSVELYPDSAFLMSDLCSDEFLNQNVSSNVKHFVDSSYLIFQAAPKKLGDSIENLAIKLSEAYNRTNKRILLLPIGYAAGHDDYELLLKLHKLIPNISDIKYNLNIWEIMYLIKHSECYIGTSLHGVITAMSFGIPHFGINPKVGKLDSFLKDWSFFPFNRCYSVQDITSLTSFLLCYDSQLKENSEKLKKLVQANNKKLFSFNTYQTLD
ncbi:polysaccharide pyruvyl transferase family protein [Thalassotalea aquiviva]|uniref:polysaccharide pyruvyl transferase family protein n=1 Tax=Thalassotalea aquiviva TaxID=3242415 RepID=UPI00352A43E6